jgi:type I restriction enzyme, S subunit
VSKERNGDVEATPAEMPVLPPGWCWTTLATIAEIEGGITKDQKRQRTSSMREVPYLRVANVQRGYLDLGEVKTILADEQELEALRLKEGDILFTEGGDRDKLGRGWVWNGEIENCIHQNHVFRARPYPQLLEPKFVSFHGNSFGQKWFTRTGKQTTNLASINKGVLSRFPVPLAPLNEQLRIVEKIEELFSDLDAGVAALGSVKVKLKRYRAAVLRAAVEGRLSADWRDLHADVEPASALLRRILEDRRRRWEEAQLARYAEAGKEPPKNWGSKYREPVALGDDTLEELPRNWCWASVDQLGDVQLGRQRSPKNRSDRHPTKYIRAANITERGLDLSDVLDMEFLPHELENYRLVEGDIVLSEASGSPDQVGKATMWKNQIENCCFQNTVVRFRPLMIDSAFAQTVFRYCYFNKQFARVAAGVGINHLSSYKFCRMPFPLAPLDEQRQIVAEVAFHLSIVEQIEAQVDADLRRAARLRQSILKRAFEGRLVPQDSNDEPAETMLLRLRSATTYVQEIGLTRGSPAKAVARKQQRLFPDIEKA